MIDDKKIEEAANKHIETEYARYNSGEVEEEMICLGGKDSFKAGAKWAINELLKDLWHPASEVPRNDNGKVLAFSREVGSRKLYDMNAMLDETTCNTYQEMWKKEVNAFRWSDWIFIEELIDLIKKGGKRCMKKNKHSLKISRSFFGDTTLDGYPIYTYSNDELKILKNLLTKVLGEVNEYIKD